MLAVISLTWGSFSSASGGQRHEAAAAVLGIGAALHEAVAFHAVERGGHGGLLDARAGGERFCGLGPAPRASSTGIYAAQGRWGQVPLEFAHQQAPRQVREVADGGRADVHLHSMLSNYIVC